MLVWMDLEMTGLDHTSDVIVEIATIVTDDDLTIIAEGPDLVIHQPDEVLAKMDPFVVDMHTRSGLLDAIRASTISLDEAGAATLEFIKQHVPEPMHRAAVRQLDRHRPPLPRRLPARRSRTTCTTARSTCRASRSSSSAGIRASTPSARTRHGAAPGPRRHPRSRSASCAYYRERVFVRPSGRAVRRRGRDAQTRRRRRARRRLANG